MVWRKLTKSFDEADDFDLDGWHIYVDIRYTIQNHFARHDQGNIIGVEGNHHFEVRLSLIGSNVEYKL